MKLSNIEDSNILGALVEETYKGVEDVEQANKVDLSTYFEMKSGSIEDTFEDHIIEDTMIKRGVTFSTLNYCEQTSCFNFELNEQIFSCPSNWGQFTKLFQLKENEYFSMINEFNSELFVENLFSDFVRYDYESICFVGHGKAFLIFLPKGNQDILGWLKKYCEVSDLAA
ncbi:hypothetical protein [Halobacteriovorax sp. HLS]|uniref:hypothetical protein n=1 Tax=Halobacteriovorax sp. HLS TaxID=2234000 RepID=UPI000FDB630D|nr:hypothetical protein [Halobacteriovorax sp. HLS]